MGRNCQGRVRVGICNPTKTRTPDHRFRTISISAVAIPPPFGPSLRPSSTPFLHPSSTCFRTPHHPIFAPFGTMFEAYWTLWAHIQRLKFAPALTQCVAPPPSRCVPSFRSPCNDTLTLCLPCRGGTSGLCQPSGDCASSSCLSSHSGISNLYPASPYNGDGVLHPYPASPYGPLTLLWQRLDFTLSPDHIHINGAYVLL